MEQTVVGDGFNGAGLQGCMFCVERGVFAHGRGKLQLVGQWAHWPALTGPGPDAAVLGTSQMKVPSPFLGFRYLI